jgi:ribonuclease HI
MSKRQRHQKQKPKKPIDYRSTLDDHIHVWCDGACHPNPNGNGGWAFCYETIIKTVKFSSGNVPLTTNNRMEVTALLMALKHFTEPGRLLILSDSRYAVNGASKWARAWSNNDWRTRGKGRPEAKNRDLWEQVLKAKDFHIDARFQWIKGHSGIELNEFCDELAQGEKRKLSEDQAGEANERIFTTGCVPGLGSDYG